ncbi:MAG: hypothetical protein Tsb002_22760 [Wenzhouxiangellaceae bacterium]
MLRTPLLPVLAIILCGLTIAPVVVGQEENAADERPTLAQLAATSDLVGIAQVYYTDYTYRHGYAVDGTAYLRMLITYRADQEVEQFRVKEKGLRDNECYFPTTEYGSDGARFLVFLSRREDGDYIGHPRLCMLPIAVTAEQAYAMPYPRPEVNLTATGEAAVTAMTFSDALAMVDVSDLTRSMAARRADELGGELRDDRIVYTQGIPIGVVRKLLGEDNLKLPRLNR